MYNKILTTILSLHILFNFALSQDDFSDEPSADANQIASISGTVTDLESGRPVAGANVVVDDSDLGAAADEDGKFIIEGVQVEQVSPHLLLDTMI